jgi:hypothetical protein
MRSIPHISDVSHTWDSWKQARASAASACGYHKSPWGFFDTEFHDGTQVDESNTRDHKNFTAPWVLYNTTLHKSDDNKEKFIDGDTWWQVGCDKFDGKLNNDMMITTISPKYEKKKICDYKI